MQKERQIDIDKRNGFKICSHCHSIRELNQFFLKRKENYYDACCKICYKNKVKRKPSQKEIDLTNNTKICKKCGKRKEIKDFCFRHDNDSYRNECKQCKLEYNAHRVETIPWIKENGRIRNKKKYWENVESTRIEKVAYKFGVTP